jgi:hypothetical protein
MFSTIALIELERKEQEQTKMKTAENVKIAKNGAIIEKAYSNLE